MSELINQIKKIPKTYFSVIDILKVSGLDESSLRVSISRLVKRGELIKIGKGIYTQNNSQVNWEELVCRLYQPSYLSFEWILAREGILSQQPYNLTLATANRSKQIKIGNKIATFHHLKPERFWGYYKKGNVLVAEKEKAFLDLAYLSLNGYAKFDPEEMNLSRLDKIKLSNYSNKFKSKKLNSLLADLKILCPRKLLKK